MYNKIKVLQIIGGLIVGGAETVAMNIFRYIDREKYEFHYVVYDEPVGVYEKEVYALGGKVIHLPHPRKGRIIFMQNLDSVIKKNGPYKVIHCHMMFSSGMMVLVAKKNKIPIRITHAHTIQNKLSTNMKVYFYEKVMQKLINHYSTDYFACSKMAGNYLFGKDVFEKSGVIIKNGIEIEKYKFNLDNRNQIRKKYMITDEKLIGNVGHLAKVKNQRFLIKIFAEVYKLDSNIKLFILGEGEERDNLEAYIEELNLKENVFLIGNTDNVNEYLSAMDVFVFPSLFEGLGLSVIEAQTNGLPCLISENIPQEVNVTDLVKRISIESSEKWIHLIIKSKRIFSDAYDQVMKENGYGIEEIGVVINQVYDRK